MIDKSKFEQMDSIFVERPERKPFNGKFSCLHFYRDILIFKNRGKIIGTVKTCFDCFDTQITGANANTENFGQGEDYRKLKKILR